MAYQSYNFIEGMIRVGAVDPSVVVLPDKFIKVRGEACSLDPFFRFEPSFYSIPVALNILRMSPCKWINEVVSVVDRIVLDDGGDEIGEI